MIYDRTFDSYTPQEKIAIREVAERMGFAVPAGMKDGQLYDANGNVIQNAIDVNQYGDMIRQMMSGTHINELLPTGLKGASQALEAGTTSALSTLGQGAEVARGDIAQSNATAQNQLGTTANQVGRAALTANQMAQDTLSGGRADVLNSAIYAFNAGRSPLEGYSNAGQMASAHQAALSGALGNGAQQTAFEQFMNSPGQQYLRDQAEKSLLRNSAAIGGLGGANVRTALQEQAIGMAAQDFNNQYERLGQVANRGYQAGQGVSSLAGQLGSAAAGQMGSLASQGAGVTGSLGANAIGQIGSLGQTGANLNAQAGQNHPDRHHGW